MQLRNIGFVLSMFINEENLNQQQIIQYVIVLYFNLPNTVEFWVKFSNKTEERISSVIARIKKYIRNDIWNNMKNLNVNSLL